MSDIATNTTTEWLPIETAPKDGSQFDAWEFCDGHIGNRQTNVFWGRRGESGDYKEEGWVFTIDGTYYFAAHPEYWMPKPLPPICVQQFFDADNIRAYYG